MERDERYGTAEIWLQMQGDKEDTENRIVLRCPALSENKKTNITAGSSFSLSIK